MSVWRAMVVVLTLIPPGGLAAAAVPGAADAGDPDLYAPAVARAIGAIAEYARWPREKREMRLCIIRPASYVGAVAVSQLSRGRVLVPVQVDTRALLTQNCDALYIGQLPLAEQRQLAELVRGQDILTFAEADPACRAHAMICFVYEPGRLSFRLNIDAVSRSSVKLDPRVLRMAWKAGAP